MSTLKRKQVVSSDDGSSSNPPVNLYLTRGHCKDEWHMWNVSCCELRLKVGEIVHGHILSSDFDDTIHLVTSVLANLTIPASGEITSLMGCDIRFDGDFSEHVLHLQSAATQGDLVDMCMSKGVKCATFLEHHIQRSQDAEFELGSKVHSLFVQTVSEMLSRRYDIKHHYPLYNRALSLHYSGKVSLEPPLLKDMICTGGLLDLSATEHHSLHGIPLEGMDHISFTKWNYSDHIENRLKKQREPQWLDVIDVSSSINHDRDTIAYREKNVGSAKTLSVNRSTCPVSLCQREEMGDISPVNTFETFNNLLGTLTDRPTAFPYIFTLHMSADLTFDGLVNYCIKRTCESLYRPVLPPRENWGSVNPVLLMEDPVDPVTGRTLRRYTVTSRGHLSTMVSNQSFCYNEVFLPGRPVSRLNLDLDLKCCQKCSMKFATKADRSTKYKVANALTKSLIFVILESLLKIAKVKNEELHSDLSIKELVKAVGKIAVYVRASSVKSKLSLRMLWYLPVELCSFEGIEAYRPLLDEMEKVSVNYVLLSYPADARSCGLCDLGDELKTDGCDNVGSRCLKLNSHRANNRCSSIDKAPYSFRKSVRLPNCYKECSSFEYVDTFNTHDIEDPGFDNPLSLSVGLSSNPILVDVTSLGVRFRGVLKARGGSQTSVISRLDEAPDQSRVETEARRLSLLWGVNVTVNKSGSGFFYVQANEKSTTYPCPIHKRVHSKSKLSALVFATQTKPKCFVA